MDTINKVINETMEIYFEFAIQRHELTALVCGWANSCCEDELTGDALDLLELARSELAMRSYRVAGKSIVSDVSRWLALSWERLDYKNVDYTLATLGIMQTIELYEHEVKSV